MKKFFFLAATLVASMSMMAAVDVAYLPTAGDKNAEGTEFDKSNKVAVAAGEKLCEGTNFTVYNAYATTYKAVGMVTDTAYSHLKIGDVVIDYNTVRIQGQDNPTAGGGNPVIDMKCPNAGACFKVNVKADGYLYVAVKTTPNKQQFVFEGVTESNGVVAGTMVGFQYLTMANKGYNEHEGYMCVEYKGAGEYNELMAPPAMPATVAGAGSYSTNGIGVLVVPVYKDAENYIVGTAGSKMMACAFAFSTEKVEVVAQGSKGVVKNDATTDYEDVVLTDPKYLVTQNCTEAPIFIRAKIPTNEAADTLAIWNKVNASDGKAAVNVAAWVWNDAVAGKWIQGSKSGSYFVIQVDGMNPVNCVLTSGKGEWTQNNAQTVDIIGITDNVCYQITGFDAANAGQKCTVQALDCVTGEELSALEEVETENATIKFIENGQLYLRHNGVVYTVTGTAIK